MFLDQVLLARLQFAFTIGFHYIFPPITIGLAWLIVYFMMKFLRSHDESYKNIARFWIKLLAITFAVGVATGITMEFQFGTNWADYSRFVGDIFGAPLAAEAIFSFFLESTFIAILIYGWGKVSDRTMTFAAWMVAIGATLSAFWIIVANSWMQTPAGFHMMNGRAELTSFFLAVFNPSTVPRFIHTMMGALMSGAFFMLGISAYQLLKGIDTEQAKRSLKVSLIAAAIFSILQLPSGHFHAIQVALTQPEKLATMEGLQETRKAAPALIFGIPDEATRTIKHAVEIPGGLSLMISGKLDHEVQGMKAFPRDELPPLSVTFYSFHLMVALGMYFIGLGVVGLFLLMRNRLYGNKFFLWIFFLSIPLPIIANELGWIAAEVGRQPWAVYHVLKTADSVSRTVSAEHILTSLIGFGTIYLLLFCAWIYLLRKKIKEGYL